MSSEFQLPLVFDLGATATFALTGALAGARRGYDIVGVFFLAAATALGGGLIRDAVLLHDGIPIAIRDPRYLITVAIACAAGLLLARRIHRFQAWIAIADALGLGAYAVVGTQLTLDRGLSLSAALLVGSLNAAGGGVLRDVLASEEPLVFKPGELYLLVATGGAFVFWLLTRQMHFSAAPAAEISIGLTFLLRLLTVRFNWRTKPALGERQT